MVLLLGLLCPHPAGAQAGRDTTVVLPEIEVEADRAQDPALTAAERLTRLGPAALEAIAARSVADVLDARTGLVVQRYGDGLATASLRGVGTAHTLVLLDGLRLADPQTGQVDLSLLPTLLLEGVEVVHGAASGRGGSGALGGAVRLHTLRADGSPSARASSSVGAFGERSGGLVAMGRTGRWAGLASFEARYAPGDFPYRDATRVPAREVRRTGADRTLTTFFGRARYRAEQTRFSIAAWHNRAERGLPGPANAPPGAARQWDRHLRLWADLTRPHAQGTTTAHLLAQQTWLRYLNPSIATDDTSRTRSLALDLKHDRVVGSHWLLEVGGTVGIDQAALRDGVAQARLGTSVHGMGAYGRWLLYPAVRADAYRSEGRTTLALSPHLGVNVQPFSTRGIRLKASVGRAFRVPTFNERFWQPGGNPDLQAERGWSLDAGVLIQQQWEPYTFEAEVTAFATRLRDQIVWRPSLVDAGVQVWRPANLNRVVTHGLEASLQSRGALGPAGFDGGFTFTLTDARDRSDPDAASYDHRLRYVPRQQLKAHAGFGVGPLRLHASARFVGHRPLTTDGSQRLAPYRVLDAQLRYTHAWDKVTATLAVAIENLLDADYAVVRFYPMPPRHARLRLTLDLHS